MQFCILIPYCRWCETYSITVLSPSLFIGQSCIVLLWFSIFSAFKLCERRSVRRELEDFFLIPIHCSVFLLLENQPQLARICLFFPSNKSLLFIGMFPRNFEMKRAYWKRDFTHCTIHSLFIPKRPCRIIWKQMFTQLRSRIRTGLSKLNIRLFIPRILSKVRVKRHFVPISDYCDT